MYTCYVEGKRKGVEKKDSDLKTIYKEYLDKQYF